MGDDLSVAVLWSPIAEEKAARIVERILREQRGVAWRWTQGLLARVGGLSHNAKRGHEVREIPRRVRVGEVTFAPYRIIYRVESDRIVILTISSARQPADDHERDRDHHGE